MVDQGARVGCTLHNAGDTGLVSVVVPLHQLDQLFEVGVVFHLGGAADSLLAVLLQALEPLQEQLRVVEAPVSRFFPVYLDFFPVCFDCLLGRCLCNGFQQSWG